MSDTLTTAEKAPLLADGVQVNVDQATIVADPAGVIEIVNEGGGMGWVYGRTAGVVVVSVTEGTRTGSDEITVTDAPIIVTLGQVVPQ